MKEKERMEGKGWEKEGDEVARETREGNFKGLMKEVRCKRPIGKKGKEWGMKWVRL